MTYHRLGTITHLDLYMKHLLSLACIILDSDTFNFLTCTTVLIDKLPCEPFISNMVHVHCTPHTRHKRGGANVCAIISICTINETSVKNGLL